MDNYLSIEQLALRLMLKEYCQTMYWTFVKRRINEPEDAPRVNSDYICLQALLLLAPRFSQ